MSHLVSTSITHLASYQPLCVVCKNTRYGPVATEARAPRWSPSYGSLWNQLGPAARRPGRPLKHAKTHNLTTIILKPGPTRRARVCGYACVYVCVCV